MQYQADLLLPFTRISAMLMVMVGIGVKTIPGPIKDGLRSRIYYYGYACFTTFPI